MKFVGTAVCGVWLVLLSILEACSSPRAYRAPASSELDMAYAPCADIAKVCEAHDAQSGLAHDCNQVARDGDDKACGPRREERRDECHRAFRGTVTGPPS